MVRSVDVALPDGQEPTGPQEWWRRLLRVPLFTKILVANGAVVALGATAGTSLATRRARRSPDEAPYAMMALFVTGGLGLSLLLNALVLRIVLRPLARLERVARRVRQGDVSVRVEFGVIGDPQTDQLTVAFNAMLDSLHERARQVEATSARLQALSDRVLLAQEAERHHLARRLQDDTGQELTTVLLLLRLLRDGAARSGTDPRTLGRQAAEAADLARQTLDGVRTLAQELRPRSLDDLGLEATVRAVAQEWQARTGIQTDVHPVVPAGSRVPPSVGIAVYRMVQEALHNVAAHAQATSVRVTLACAAGQLIVEVRDDGRGMATTQDRVTTPGGLPHGPDQRVDAAGLVASPGVGLGLFSVQERIGLVGGSLTVDSAPRRGTAVRAVIPLPAGGTDALPKSAAPASPA